MRQNTAKSADRSSNRVHAPAYGVSLSSKTITIFHQLMQQTHIVSDQISVTLAPLLAHHKGMANCDEWSLPDEQSAA